MDMSRYVLPNCFLPNWLRGGLLTEEVVALNPLLLSSEAPATCWDTTTRCTVKIAPTSAPKAPTRRTPFLVGCLLLSDVEECGSYVGY